MLLPRQATPQMTQQEHKPLKLEADEDGQLSPLFAAAWGGDVTAAEKALDAGEAVNARDADAAWTALTFAAFQGHTAVAELLLARGADVDSKTTDDATPLMLAVGLTVPGLDPGLIHFLSSVNVKCRRHDYSSRLMLPHRVCGQRPAGTDPDIDVAAGWPVPFSRHLDPLHPASGQPSMALSRGRFNLVRIRDSAA